MSLASFNLQFKKIHLFYLVNFLAAFLLFQIELIISKIFLPKYGGSYLVWGACVVFFQATLLLGYLYSHIAVSKTWIFKYKYLRLALFILPLLFFPGRPLSAIAAASHLPLVIGIFLQLFVSIGVVFFALSTVSIVTQSWLSLSDLPEHSNPFVLYGVSNLGSFLALLSYPFIFEAVFDINQQLAIWRIGYLVFLLFYFAAFYLIKVGRIPCPGGALFDGANFLKKFEYTADMRKGVSWFLLSAAGSIMFLSVTNVITYEITPCPVLWIMPLCIYLFSFVLNFKEKPFFPEWIRNNINLWIGFTALLFFITQMRVIPLLFEIAAYCFSLFILCMYCQRELYLSRPGESGRLTVFYLIIALGGVGGSILVTWIAPLFFIDTLEFIFGLFVIAMALDIRENKPKAGFLALRFIAYMVPILILWPLVFKRYNFFGIVVIIFLFKWIFSRLKTGRALSLCLAAIFLVAAIFSGNWRHDGRSIYTARNYYGIYRVSARDKMVILLNGTTLHGQQFIADSKRREPLSYFYFDSPIGKLLNSDILQVKNMGVIGLGTGTLAAYGRQDREIDFFELDPEAFYIADNFFTYLKDSLSKIHYFFGDARVSLTKTPENKYDLLVMDAFSGDSVPVHLLTVDAIREYRKRLKPGGAILFHITNRYFDLVPVLFTNAKALSAYAVFNFMEGEDNVYLATSWVALTWDARFKDDLVKKLNWKEEGNRFKVNKARPWTDAYSNLLSALKFKSFIYPIKYFRIFYW